MFVLEEIQLSVPKKSNCVKANYLGGPALISHLKIPFVSRLVFLRLSLSNKKYIIKFKCHDIQSTDSGPSQPWGILNSEKGKPKIFTARMIISMMAATPLYVYVVAVGSV